MTPADGRRFKGNNVRRLSRWVVGRWRWLSVIKARGGSRNVSGHFAHQGQRLLSRRGWGSYGMLGSWGENEAPVATGSGLICPCTCCWDYWLFLTCSFSVPLSIAQTLFGVGRFSCWAIRVFTSACSLVVSLDEEVQKVLTASLGAKVKFGSTHAHTDRRKLTQPRTQLSWRERKKRRVVHNPSFSG